MRFSKFWNTLPKVSTLTAWIFWRIAPLSCSIVRGVFLYTLPFNRPQRKNRQALDRFLLVSNVLTNFWVQHLDGACLSPNSVRNAIWHALNEPVCQYLRTRNPRCSTVYIDNSLEPLARDSPCIYNDNKNIHNCGQYFFPLSQSQTSDQHVIQKAIKKQTQAMQFD